MMNLRFTQFDEMLPLAMMKDSPYQRNTHPREQILSLAKIMLEEGVTHPICISKQSGTICFGHGRKEAALLNGWIDFPVVYIDFESPEAEYRAVQSDNGLAQWSILDFKQINADVAMGTYGPFPIELLGIKEFTVTPFEEKKPRKKEPVICPHCGEQVT